MRRTGPSIRAPRPYGDDSTSVGDALLRGRRLGVEADGGGFEALAELVVAPADGKGGAAAG